MSEEQHPKKPVSPLYLGFDFSTQQLKVLCVSNSLKITHEFIIDFDKDLREFGTKGGVRKHNDGLTVTAPPTMWIKALDLLLERMKEAEFPFEDVKSISGCGQQHGSVYWKKGSERILKGLRKEEPLSNQLKDCFSVPESPVWMDSSTRRQCLSLEALCGGPQTLANKTGSRAYERFTGNQIGKLFQHRDSNHFNDTERISLVSSCGASLFLGRYANIEYSDGSGMNVLDIDAKDWWDTALDACADNLRELLGEPVASNAVLGNISSYFVERYGFPSSCKVIAYTGDNPSSLAGLRLEQGDVVVSLGTSDTLFMWIDEARPQLMGHVFVNPVNKDAYMAMLCYKNGSKTREHIRDDCGVTSWEEFNELIDKTSPGNNGNIGIYFRDPEITPPGCGTLRMDKDGHHCKEFPKEVEVRALVEGQFLAKLSHATKLGFQITQSTRVLATGGASKNIKILQIIADVFNSSIYVIDGTANSACLGGAYRAKHGVMTEGTQFRETVREAQPYKQVATPREDIHKVYLSMLDRYVKFEEDFSKELIE